MTSTKHTPGPWTHSNLVVRAGRSQKHPMGRQIADCYRELPAGHFDGGENAANARLIAAAPDMLEALIKLRDSAKGLSGSDQEWIVADAIELANAAIALGTDSSEVEG